MGKTIYKPKTAGSEKEPAVLLNADGGGRTRTVLPPTDFEFSVDIHFTSLHVTSSHFSSLANHAISSIQNDQISKMAV